MWNILDEAKRIFGEVISVYEALKSLDIHAHLPASLLPNSNEIREFINHVPNRDGIAILMINLVDEEVLITRDGLWAEEYQQFVDAQDEEDQIRIDITIQKTIQNNTLTIYSYKTFKDFLEERTLVDQMKLFSAAMREAYSYLRFEVLSDKIAVYTKYMAFCDVEEPWFDFDPNSRKNDFQKCEDAGIFLDRKEMCLIPQDLAVQMGSGNADIIPMLNRLETVFAYAYVANSAYIEKDALVLQIETGKGFELNLNALSINDTICAIYRWIYGDINAVEKAAIARNIIKLYCRSIDQLYDIGEDVLYAIRSSYMIYQKDAAEQYLELKKKIAEHIVENTKQIQELVQGLAEGFRNNLIAVITFIITAVLTEAISEETLKGSSLPRNLIFVSIVFIIVSAAYLLLSWRTFCLKKRFLIDQYNDLKDSYRDILDEKDISLAFSNDDVFRKAMNGVNEHTNKLLIIWALFIVVMMLVVIIFG